MRKTTIKTIETTRCYCDLCGKESFLVCPKCGRDICSCCRVLDWRDSFNSFSNFWCQECDKIGGPFIEKIKEENKRHEEEIHELENFWKITASRKRQECEQEKNV